MRGSFHEVYAIRSRHRPEIMIFTAYRFEKLTGTCV